MPEVIFIPAPAVGGPPAPLLVFSSVLYSANFNATENEIAIIDSDSCDPPITMTLPLAPTANTVCGFVFSNPTNPPVPSTSGLNVNAGAFSIAGIPIVDFPQRWPNGPILFKWSVLQSMWEPLDWSTYILSAFISDEPKIMVRQGVGFFGRMLTGLAMFDNTILARLGNNGYVQGLQANATSIIANFPVKPYSVQDGLGAYSGETFADGLNTLLPSSGVVYAADFTCQVNRLHLIQTPDNTVITATLPAVADMLGGEQVLVLNTPSGNGSVRIAAAGATLFVPEVGFLAGPYTLSQPNAIVLAQFQNGVWYLIASGYDASRVVAQTFSGALAAGVGATTDVPGPAAGFIRIFDSVQVVADVMASPLVGVTGDIIVPGPTAYRLGRTTSASTFNLIANAIGEGEVVRVTNNGGTSGQVRATYFDVPNGGGGAVGAIGLVRLFVGDALQTAIPEPPVGFYRRWLQYPIAQNTTRAPLCRVALFNDDTVTHSIEFYVGAALLSRAASAVAGTLGTAQPPIQWPIVAGGGALQIATIAPITTNPYVLTGAYETLPL